MNVKITFIHPGTGKRLTVPTSQVVVTDDVGRPLALSYEEGGTIIHVDALDGDFIEVCTNIGLKPEPVQLIKV